MLVDLPIAGKSCGSPPGDSVIDGHWSYERKQYRRDLNGESNRIETPSGASEVLERHEQQEVQQRRPGHPKRHYGAK
jgi:hypothetical protein